MHYPSEFPLENTKKAEKVVFDALRRLPTDDFDVYFGRKFSAIEKGEKVEYEIDFLIADLRGGKLNALLCLEVKGGKIAYDGRQHSCQQNQHKLNYPIKKVTRNMQDSMISISNKFIQHLINGIYKSGL